jgi:uncharacterized protein YdeI (YjbR/CyaY-like superfamily)
MAVREKVIDEYIARSADFAKPILLHIRELVHRACPKVEEKIKWGFPFFDYKGQSMCHVSAFKKHAVMGFWKAPLMKDPILVANAKSEVAMGHLGKIVCLKDLPPDKTIISWIKEAMELNDNGIKLPAKVKSADRKQLIVPAYFVEALEKHTKAKQVFEAFTYSHKKEYLEWITEAKTEITRKKRMLKAIEMMEEDKSLNWKYK